MLTWLKSLNPFRSRSRQSYPLDRIPEGYFPDKEHNPDSSLSLSPFWAGLRLFQSTVGSLPLVTYREGKLGRERYKSHPAYYLLHSKPNPSMTRATFWERNVDDLFRKGEFFIHVIWSGNGKPKHLLPVPHSAVQDVRRLPNWKKEYKVRVHVDGVQRTETVPHEDMIHCVNFPDEDGLRGKSLETFACEALGLHKQVQEAGTAFFRNAVRPGNYVSFPGKVDNTAARTMVSEIDANHAGPGKRGKTFWLEQGGVLNPLNNTTAEEARIVEMLSASVADIARWFGVSPLTLGDLSRGTYSNLAADNSAFYQRSIRPLLDKIELAVNDCIFGEKSDAYAEFLVDAILRGDPLQQMQIDIGYTNAGIYLRSEPRRWKNLPDIPGLDTPTLPLNMGGNPETSAINPEVPNEQPVDSTSNANLPA